MSEFVEYLGDLFAEFGEVRARRMFGGHGLFHDGLMIGLVADDVVYLKVDGESEGAFIEAAMPAFTYRKRDREVTMSFRQAPPEAMESAREMTPWARLAFAAALRQKK